VPATPVRLAPSTFAPAGAPLPVDGGADVTFALGAFSMQQNMLLVPFDDTPGANTIQDRSPTRLTGRVDGGLTIGVPGIAGTAARFDGGCVVFDSTPAFDPGPTLSIALWIRPRNLDGVAPHGLVSRRVDFQAESQFTFFLWLNNRLWVDLETENDRFEGTRSIPNDVWTHVALVYDGRVDAGVRARVYVDGQLDAEAPETSASLPPRTIPVVLGCLPNPSGGTDQSYDGDMDEVALFSRALSQAEVASLYARGASRHRVSLRACDTGTCADGGVFTPVTPGTLVGVPESRFFQYQLHADAPVTALEWSTVSGLTLEVECPRQPDAGPGDAGVDGGPFSAQDAGLDAGASDGGAMDAGEPTRPIDAGVEGEVRRLEVGFGCSTGEGVGLVLLLVALVARRRSTHPRARG
jgi:hypothetical protein